MNGFILTVAAFATSVVSALPLYGGGYYPGMQSSHHNAGAYDNGATTNMSPFGSSSNSWNNGFSSTQDSAASPFGSSGSSSFNQWNSNAWSNNYNPYGFYGGYAPYGGYGGYGSHW
ncbi:hypothetical protein EC988_004643 [Linderina pennispora]|nr:hypothetical protein EC988_004643 [Linderina pennispora]